MASSKETIGPQVRVIRRPAYTESLDPLRNTPIEPWPATLGVKVTAAVAYGVWAEWPEGASLEATIRAVGTLLTAIADQTSEMRLYENVPARQVRLDAHGRLAGVAEEPTR